MAITTLADNLNQRLSDIQSKITQIQATAAAEIAVLQKKAAILEAAGQLVTPEIETAVSQLQQIGVLTQL